MANRTIAIGDIHGCADALQSLLDVIQPEASDTIITLGDYIDRGPKSSQVISILADLITQCTLVPLLGNHEIMMTNALKSRRDFEFWLYNGGKATLQSYDGDMNNMPMHHRTFINFCKPWHETESHIFLHAAYDPSLPLDQQPDELLFWQHVDERFTPGPHHSGKTIVCGHTPQVEGDVGDLGHIKLIDTFCYGDLWLTAYDVDTGEHIQARTDGMLRPERSAFRKNAGPPQIDDSKWNDDLQVKNADWPFTESSPSPLELSGNEFEDLTRTVAIRLGDYLENQNAFPVKNSPPSDSTINNWDQQLQQTVPRQPAAIEKILDTIFNDFVPSGYNTTSHGFLAYVPGGGLPEAALGDLIASVTNRYSPVWVAAPALAQIESTVVDWFRQMVGYGKNAGGFLTTGGSLANMSALVAARVKMLGDDFSLARIYTSNQSHHCVDKAAFIAGFPKSNLRKVGVNPDQTIDLEALKKMIDSDRAAGFQPIMVVANAGTINTGAVDDLTGLHQICDAENLWLHVDAAYGGFFMLTEQGRKIMQGIEHADSIVLDPHKGLFLPYGTGCLLVKNRDDLLPAFSFTSEYMPEMSGDTTRQDSCEIMPELSRDHRGLRIWLPVMRHGIEVFETLLKEKLDLTAWAQARLQQLKQSISVTHPSVNLELAAQPQLSVLAFRLYDSERTPQQNDRLNQNWLDEINQDGSVMLSSTRVNDVFVLRICVLSFRTHIDRMQQAMHIITESAKSVLQTSEAM